LRFLRRIIQRYFRGNLGLSILTISSFIAGITMGTLFVRFLGAECLQKMQISLDMFFQDLRFYPDRGLDPYYILKASYRKNISFLILAWLFGFLRLGFPFVLLALLLRGLALGFTSGFLVYSFALKGLILSLALLPHHIILVPALLLVVAVATAYSYMNYSEKVSYKKKAQLKLHFREYCIYMFLSAVLILAAGLVEAYISPIFMRQVVSFIF
jgi:stage II sporulation protein M